MELKRLRDGIRPTQVAYASQGLAEWDAHVTGSLLAETRDALKQMFDVQGKAGGLGRRQSCRKTACRTGV